MPGAALKGDAENARAVFASCIVTRAYHDWQRDDFVISAVSPQFDPVPPDGIAPEYLWVITVSEPLGQVTARAQKIEAPAVPEVTKEWLSQLLQPPPRP